MHQSAIMIQATVVQLLSKTQQFDRIQVMLQMKLLTCWVLEGSSGQQGYSLAHFLPAPSSTRHPNKYNGQLQKILSIGWFLISVKIGSLTLHPNELIFHCYSHLSKQSITSIIWVRSYNNVKTIPFYPISLAKWIRIWVGQLWSWILVPACF